MILGSIKFYNADGWGSLRDSVAYVWDFIRERSLITTWGVDKLAMAIP